MRDLECPHEKRLLIKDGNIFAACDQCRPFLMRLFNQLLISQTVLIQVSHSTVEVS